jgi:hypothetical protein
MEGAFPVAAWGSYVGLQMGMGKGKAHFRSIVPEGQASFERHSVEKEHM